MGKVKRNIAHRGLFLLPVGRYMQHLRGNHRRCVSLKGVKLRLGFLSNIHLGNFVNGDVGLRHQWRAFRHNIHQSLPRLDNASRRMYLKADNAPVNRSENFKPGFCIAQWPELFPCLHDFAIQGVYFVCGLLDNADGQAFLLQLQTGFFLLGSRDSLPESAVRSLVGCELPFKFKDLGFFKKSFRKQRALGRKFFRKRGNDGFFGINFFLRSQDLLFYLLYLGIQQTGLAGI